ncbi:hypothetical protein A3D25_01515 [Candidatus Daviesbacteria bacterium RIFCSPHIGHO2_02_FULL_43_12]|uniref:D-isomer specific 2-hydroxyacid dehydrogenase NAD-binding domain-containing protein n=1 Tax=Candidatus Daviesbacteria bacterium RIFCSPHIGHO2_02_FULL_43_12 TaxID=1797776 RepID=A0A1F5KJU7_9BACT|nr:MAG: hypothetical protein A3D25_01515 [Candidatus Daviesbacteria bacterium RIFCSPHIGHO2_02_FULL_43_12]OGE69392.1 MAG: hypothetical protein A3B55_03255 [Candidatus Daviesbacteria bacterium RIFCSPLOWO2_01_FULL_43_15]
MFSREQIEFLRKHFFRTEFYNDTYSPALAAKRIKNHNVVIMDQFLLTLDESVFKQCRGIELVIVNTTAYDNLDINLLQKYKVKLSHLKEYATNDVAEVGFGMMLALNNRIEYAKRIVSEQGVTDLFPGHPAIDRLKRKSLRGQTVGIVGLGKIGSRFADMCLTFGIKVIAYSRSSKIIKGIKLVSIKKLFKSSDIFFISQVYKKPEMDRFISAELLNLAKEKAILISICHPNLIDFDFLIKNHRKFSGIGLDYLVTSEVLKLSKVRNENIIITPHLGSQSEEAIFNMTDSLISLAVDFALGKNIYTVV